MMMMMIIYLRAELNSQWPITESALTQTTTIGQMQGQNEEKQGGLKRSNCLFFFDIARIAEKTKKLGGTHTVR
jgi:hypothetical protein